MLVCFAAGSKSRRTGALPVEYGRVDFEQKIFMDRGKNQMRELRRKRAIAIPMGLRKDVMQIP